MSDRPVETDRSASVSASRSGRAVSILALLAVAVASGAFVGFVAAGFIWVIEHAVEFVWSDLPDRVGVDPFNSWWIFAVPAVGGVLVGLGQLFVGNYPRPMEEALTTWRSGKQIPPGDAPRTAIMSFVSLVMGGPVGFEAALVGLLGGTATFVGRWLHSVGRLLRQVWGAERIDELPHRLHQTPYWVAAVSALLTYRWMPFGAVDMGFRFDVDEGGLGVGEAFAVIGFALIVTIPTVFAFGVVQRAERSMFFRRSPIVVGVAGALLFALLGLGNELVLFSGQQGFQALPGMGVGALVYVTVAKWGALVIALFAGWRGGPIFPMLTSAAALGVLFADLVDVRSELIMIAGIAAVSIVLTKGNVLFAFVLSLYVVPLGYAVVTGIGCVGAVVGLVVLRSFGLLPEPTVPTQPVEPAVGDGDVRV